MDSTLIGVLIGSLSSILGTIVVNWFTLHKEDKQWLRKQAAEQKKREMKEYTKREQQLRETYQNCLRCLSTLVAAEQGKIRIADEEKTQFVQEAHRWLSLLTLTHQNKSTRRRTHFEVSLSTFRTNPEYALEMLEDVEALVRDDAVLFPREIKEPPHPNQTGDRGILVNIDKEFRRSQFAQGIELPDHHRFQYNIAQMTLSQREKLWDMYFEQNQTIPANVSLKIPRYDPTQKRIIFREYWQAQLNPLTTNPEDIFVAWETAFEQAIARNQEVQGRPPNKARLTP